MIITYEDLLNTMADERCGWRETSDGRVCYYARANGSITVAADYPAATNDSMTPAQIREHRKRLLTAWLFGTQQQENGKGGSLSKQTEPGTGTAG